MIHLFFKILHMKDIILKAIRKFSEDQINLYATQAAFYFIVSAVPFFMFLLSLMRFILPITEAEIRNAINMSIPNSLNFYVSVLMNDLYTGASVPLVSISALTTLWASSKGTYTLAQGLNAIHRMDGTKDIVRRRAFSIFNTILIMLTLIFSLIVLIFGNQLYALIVEYFPKRFDFVLQFLNFHFIISLIVMTLIIMVLYTLLPDKKIDFWKQLPGAIWATLCWMFFSYLYSWYINNFSNFSFTYGILAAAIFMMLWLKICLSIFLLSAEFNVYLPNIKEILKKYKR